MTQKREIVLHGARPLVPHPLRPLLPSRMDQDAVQPGASCDNVRPAVGSCNGQLPASVGVRELVASTDLCVSRTEDEEAALQLLDSWLENDDEERHDDEGVCRDPSVQEPCPEPLLEDSCHGVLLASTPQRALARDVTVMMPRDILLRVLSFVSASDLCSLQVTCRQVGVAL